MDYYAYHQIQTRPRTWQTVAEALMKAGVQQLDGDGGRLFGIFRNQIGRPRDELSLITAWSESPAPASWRGFLDCAGKDVLDVTTQLMRPTLRPERFEAPRRQGNFAFRWFETPAENYAEFLELCAGAWPGFESAYDSQVLGLWRLEPEPRRGKGKRPATDCVNTLLLTRRPDLAMWERSKKPADAKEAEVRRKLSRRYDLCDATWVFTTTLLSAADAPDEVRWA